MKPFCEKNFTEFLARVEKMVSVFILSHQLETFLEAKNSEYAVKKQKKINKNGKNLSFTACKLVVPLYIKQ